MVSYEEGADLFDLVGLGLFLEAKLGQKAANTLIWLIHQANYLLDQQLRQLEERFLKEGGFTERLYNKRREARRTK